MEKNRGYTRVRVCSLIICLGLFLALCACSTQSSVLKQSYDTVYAASATYDSSMKIVGDMYKTGRINEEQKNKIIDYAHKYYNTIHVVKKALIAYKQAQLDFEEANTQENEDKLKMAEIVIINSLQLVQAAEIDLLKLIE
jgi:hypothetical protein